MKIRSISQFLSVALFRPWYTHAYRPSLTISSLFTFIPKKNLTTTTKATTDRRNISSQNTSASLNITQTQNHLDQSEIMKNTQRDIGNAFQREDECDDSDKRIQLPVLKYGFRTVPLDWYELMDIILMKKDLARLCRSVEQQRDYEIYLRDIQRQYRSVYDHLLCTKFGLERRIDPQTNLSYAHPPLSEIRQCFDMDQHAHSPNDVGVLHPNIRRTALLLNDFPYYTAANIQHWIYWKLGGQCDEQDAQRARQELKERLGEDNVVDMLHWINPPHLKSLPDIDHVHILCLIRPLPSLSQQALSVDSASPR